MTPDVASRFVGIALGHVGREYPHKLDHVMDGPADVRTPRDLHPIFFGSFDWHSCVHSHWLLARLLRACPDMPEAPAIRELFDTQFTTANVAGELAYLSAPSSRGFVRPYGWAWLLKLAAELRLHDADWSVTLAPLSEAFAARFTDFLPKLTYPLRVGTHFNIAFALRLALDYADANLAGLIGDRARVWFAGDRDCQAWEPGGDEFLSPALCEAVLMRRVLPPGGFAAWFATFLPGVGDSAPAALFAPATVSDRSDGKIAHLDGLNLSRAWCWRELAPSLPVAERNAALAAADRHVAASLPHIVGDYMGEHWLATYAAMAMLAEDGV